MSELAAEWVDVTSLKPWADNPRKNDAAVLKVAASIKRFGFGSPILARQADREIIAGHTRLRAAQHLGLTKVPVRFLDLDPADAHLLALADNKLNEIAEWDESLGSLLSDYSFSDAELAGWDSKELERMATDAGADELDTKPQLGDELTYRVVVQCSDEADQAELIAELESNGRTCQPLIS